MLGALAVLLTFLACSVLVLSDNRRIAYETLIALGWLSFAVVMISRDLAGAFRLRRGRRCAFLAISLTPAVAIVGLAALAGKLQRELWPPLTASVVIWLVLALVYGLMSRVTALRWLPATILATVSAGLVAATFFTTAPPPAHSRVVWGKALHDRRFAMRTLIAEIDFRGCTHPAGFHLVVLVSNNFPHYHGHLDTPSFATAPAVVTPPQSKPLAYDSLLKPKTRGIASCYLVLPGYIGKGTNPPTLAIDHAETDLDLNGAGLSVSSGPAPTVSGDPARWRCTPPLWSQYTPSNESADCSAVVALTSGSYEAVKNILLLVLGALIAALVTLIVSASTTGSQA